VKPIAIVSLSVQSVLSAERQSKEFSFALKGTDSDAKAVHLVAINEDAFAAWYETLSGLLEQYRIGAFDAAAGEEEPLSEHMERPALMQVRISLRSHNRSQHTHRRPDS
jgi:hypothetical protein